MNPRRLPDAELAVMQALWKLQNPATRPQLDEVLAEKMSWVPTTILNLLTRLEAKSFVAREKQGKGYLYSALITKEMYLQAESSQMLTRMFDGSAKQFIAALHAGESLTAQDISELTAYLKELKKEKS